MTIRHPFPQLTDRLFITKSHPRQLVVFPAQNKPALRRSETAAEDVVKGIKVVPPLRAGDQPVAYLLEKTFQGVEVVPVNLQHWLRRIHDAQRLT
jgi:hypothetical protein